MPRACVIVLDAVGAGELPDAADFGDATEILAGWLEGRITTDLGQQAQRAED